MEIINYLRKKYIRLQGSRNVMKLNYIIEKYIKANKLGDIGLDFSDKPSRQFIVQEIINIKKYKSYLEIGTFHNDLFDNISVIKKLVLTQYLVEQLEKLVIIFLLVTMKNLTVFI